MVFKINVASTDLGVMNYLKESFGGTISTHPSKGNCKVWYQWGICSGEAANILEMLLPYMKIKRERALLGLEWQATVRKNGQYSSDELEWREFYHSTLRELNRKGIN